MVVWRGGKGGLVPGIGWLCGGKVRGISARHWMVVWRGGKMGGGGLVLGIGWLCGGGR